MHEVSRTYPHLGVAVIAELVHARVFQEAAEDADDLDVVAEAGHSRAEGADAPHPDLDRHARLGGAVEGVDDALVDDSVALKADSGGQSRPRVLDLAIDAVDEAVADGVRGDEQPVVVGVHRVAREHVEEV